jgi:hypothetical protein
LVSTNETCHQGPEWKEGPRINRRTWPPWELLDPEDFRP